MGMDQQVMERDAAEQRNIDMRELADLLAWSAAKFIVQSNKK